MIIGLPTMVEAVKGAKQWMTARRNLNFFEGPLVIIKEIPVIKEILMNTYFPRGIEAMSVILRIADDWEPDKLGVEDHVVLALRKLRQR